MPTRVCQFTDTAEWYAGRKTKSSFNQSLDDWAAQIGAAHDRPVRGFEFIDPIDDPRTGIFVEDPAILSPPDPDRDALKLALDDLTVPDYAKAIIRKLGVA